jgi:hypothetical protein
VSFAGLPADPLLSAPLQTLHRKIRPAIQGSLLMKIIATVSYV